MTIDLHTHSCFSDGTMSPSELLRLASLSGVSAIALTDHDTMDGIPEALAATNEFDVELVPGLEISAVHEGMVLHILGYYVDPAQKELAEALDILQRARNERNAKIIARLQDLGVDVTMEELAEISGVGQTGRPHIARMLIRHGAASSMSQAFAKYLVKGASAYAGRFTFSAMEAIKLIRGAGGLAVLAHPVQVDKTLSALNFLLPALKSYGLQGIETYYPTQKKKMRKRIRKFAEKHNLFLTGGSDYHGDNRPGTRLAGGHNVHVPPELLDIMKERLLKQESC